MFGKIKFPIAISGKARSGKDTVTKLLIQAFGIKQEDARIDALANPMKHIIKIMFPNCSNDCLYGESELRANVISPEYKDKSGKQLTYRQALLDLGAFARKYNDDIWLHCLLNEVEKNAIVHIISDIRRRNEFNFFKNKGFTMIRVIRNDYTKIDDLSETEQDTIDNNEFHFVIDNNFTIEDLTTQVNDIVGKLKEYK